MDSKEIAKAIFNLSKGKQDFGLGVLEIIALLGQGNVNDVIRIYKQILSGQVKIAEVFVKNELSKEQMSEIEKKVQAKFQDVELIFEFNSSDHNKAGILIKIGDNVLDGTV